MPFTPGNNLGQGRPKGSPNKDNRPIRDAIHAIVEGNLEDFTRVLGEMQETNPVKYAENIRALMEYTVPKLRSVDTNISMDAESLGSIKIEVITKEKNEGA
jgi:hypothetical protein